MLDLNLDQVIFFERRLTFIVLLPLLFSCIVCLRPVLIAYYS